MLDENAKRTLALTLYNKAMDNNKELHKIIVSRKIFTSEFALVKDEFLEISSLFLYELYRDILNTRYDAKDIFDVTKFCVQILTSKSKFLKITYRILWDLYCDISQDIIQTSESVSRYDDLAALYTGYIYVRKSRAGKSKENPAFEGELSFIRADLSDYFRNFFISNKDMY